MIEIGLLSGVIMFFVICQMWISRVGLLRIAWDRHGISRLAAVVASVAGFSMCVGVAATSLALVEAGWLLALPAAVIMFVVRSKENSLP